MDTIMREILHLSVPALGALQPVQIRSEACVWCPAPLDGSTIHLGRRSGTLMGIVLPWEPRAHTGCVRGAVRRELAAHAGKCTSCGPGDICDARRALRRLAWEDC